MQFGGSNVRCAPYVTFGTPALAAHAVKALKGRTACLLANHGMILYARDTDQALTRAVLLESLCRQFLLALSARKAEAVVGATDPVGEVNGSKPMALNRVRAVTA